MGIETVALLINKASIRISICLWGQERSLNVPRKSISVDDARMLLDNDDESSRWQGMCFEPFLQRRTVLRRGVWKNELKSIRICSNVIRSHISRVADSKIRGGRAARREK